MQKIELNKENRMQRRTNSELMSSIKTQIQERVDAEFAKEAKGLTEANETLYNEEKEFKKQVQELFKSITPNVTKLKIKTQTGPNGGEVISEYNGLITKFYSNYNCDLFDFMAEERGSFSVGISCLQSIEIIEEKKIENEILNEFDTVELLEDFKGELGGKEIMKGSKGTIVHVYNNDCFEVEFITPTLNECETVKREQIKKYDEKEIIHSEMKTIFEKYGTNTN